MKDITEKYKEVLERNNMLEEILRFYENTTNIVLCKSCGLPLKSNTSRIKVLTERRSKGGCIESNKTIAIFHLGCFDRLGIIKKEKYVKT